MTPEQTPGDQNAPEPRLPPESRAARSLVDRSKVEDTPVEETPTRPEPERGPRLWPRVVGVLILLLGVGGTWLWLNPGFVQRSLGSIFPATQNADATAIQALQARVTKLEQQPPPTDLTALTQRMDALEARLIATPAPSGPTASQSPPGPDVRPLLTRLDALEKLVAERTVDPGRIDALAARVQTLSSQDPATDLRGRLDQMEHQIGGLTEGSDHAARLARLNSAEIALAAGHPLGAIPDAPPALTRFATATPPTQAALLLAFPAAAEAALKVSQPDSEGQSFLDRIVARLHDFRLITVREGDRVLLGNAASVTLAKAQTLLEAGDLAGAAREVATLTGPPAEKMAPWLAQAQSVVAAREALATLAEHG